MSKVDLVSEELGLASEDDLWKLFRTTTLPEDGHKLPGERAHEFRDIWEWLHYPIGQKAKNRPLFNLKCDDRFYYLRSRSAVAVVPQSALLKVGRVMRDRVTVQYLGTDPKSDGGCAVFNPDKDPENVYCEIQQWIDNGKVANQSAGVRRYIEEVLKDPEMKDETVSHWFKEGRKIIEKFDPGIMVAFDQMMANRDEF
jgi:hypothetical protein